MDTSPLLYTLVGLLTVVIAGWLISRFPLSRGARYQRRLRLRQEQRRLSDRAREQRMKEGRMRQMQAQGARWKEDGPQADQSDREWRQSGAE